MRVVVNPSERKLAKLNAPHCNESNEQEIRCEILEYIDSRLNLKREENVWEIFSSYVNKCSKWVRDFA